MTNSLHKNTFLFLGTYERNFACNLLSIYIKLKMHGKKVVRITETLI
jgi:hypothetical protein